VNRQFLQMIGGGRIEAVDLKQESAALAVKVRGYLEELAL
jgi:hypothetical protein